MKKKIVIFASGSGSNAQNIIEYFSNDKYVEVTMIFTNRKTAGVIERVRHFEIETCIFSKDDWHKVGEKLEHLAPDLIVLAGFLLKFPEQILRDFHNMVINIHPALLPKYGGKGMYGKYVHEAIIKNKEVETGISIHYVNENYDEGAMILQKKTPISQEDSMENILKKVNQLEYEWYPKVIEGLLKDRSSDCSFENQ